MFLTENPFSDHGPSKKVQESIGKTAGDKSYYHLQRAKALAKKDGHDYDKLPKYDRAKPHQDHYHDMAKKESVKNEAFKYHIPEDIPANERTAFHGAAAAAAKAGKKNFNFGGKTHPVTMKKDTAKAIPTEAKVQEISKGLAKRYIGKAARDVYFKGRSQATKDAISQLGGPDTDYKKSPERKAAMRMRGIDRATKRLAKNESVNEAEYHPIKSSYHDDMAKAHASHAKRHKSEGDSGKHNSDNEDMHYRAIDIHKQAHDAHKAAAEAASSLNQSKYKKAAKDAHEYSKTAIGTTKDAGKFKTGTPKHSFPKLKLHTKLTKLNIKSESTMSIRDKLMSLYEGDRAAHYKSATPPEEYDELSKSSKGAMDMMKNRTDTVTIDGNKAAKATADNIKKSAPGKKLRKTDNNIGDLAIKPSATPVKDPAAKIQTAESVEYHKKMSTVHDDHGGAHERESTNGGSSDHDFASDHHHEAAKRHREAADAHKKHGGDSKQYKSAAAEAHKATGEAHETAKDAGKIKNVQPSMMKFPKKPSMKKEEYGISGNKVSSTLLDAINQVTKEGSIKGSGTDRKAVLKKAFRAGEDDTRRFYSGKKPTIKPPKGMRDLKKFDAKHKDKGIQKAFA